MAQVASLSIEFDDNDSCNSMEALLELLGLEDAELSSASVPQLLQAKESPDTSDVPSQRSFVPLSLPPNCSRYGYSPHECAAVLVENFCSPAECQAIVQLALQQGPDYITHASHTSADGTSFSVPLQNPNPHKLAVFQHDATLRMLEQRIMKLLCVHSTQPPPGWLCDYQRRTGYGPVLGLNPRLRVLRYDALDNDRFEPHFDATTVIQGQSSRITVLLYLNSGRGQDFQGGETLFLNNSLLQSNGCNGVISDSVKNGWSVSPQTGRLVMFEHDLYHSSAPLHSGTKFVLRTDILLGETKKKDTREVISAEGTVAPLPPQPSSSTTSPLMLVVDLCRLLNWSCDKQAILDEMHLLHGTINAFLVPGIWLLTQLLREAGLAQLDIEALLTLALKHQTG